MRVIGSQNVGCLNQLIVDGFDNEQIWQQIELYNNAVLGHHEQLLDFLISGRDKRLKKQPGKQSEKRTSETKRVTFEPTDEVNECIEEQPRIQSRNKQADQHVADLDKDTLQEEDEEESEEEKELEELLKKVTGKDMKDVTDSSETDDDLDDIDDTDRFSDSDNSEKNVDSDEDEEDVDFKLNDSSVDKLKNKLKFVNDKKKLQFAKSVVDDKFFKLSEMEAFLDEQDKKASRRKPDGDNTEESDEEEEMSDDDDDDDDETVCAIVNAIVLVVKFIA